MKKNQILPRRGDCLDDVTLWASKIKTLLERVVEWRGLSNSIGVLHDAPYPYYLPYIIPAAKRSRGGKEPILFASERDPDEWVASRTKIVGADRIQQSVILCKDPPVDTVYGAGEFDLLGCVDRALVAENKSLSAFDVFTTFKRETYGMGKDVFRAQQKLLIGAFKRHQNTMRKHVNFSINLFTVARTGASLSTKEIAQLIEGNVHSIQPREDKLCQIIDKHIQQMDINSFYDQKGIQ